MATEVEERIVTVREEVWAAEDGRCEACGRAMNRTVARLKRRQTSDFALDKWALVCPFCQGGWKAPFGEVKVDRQVAEVLSEGLSLEKPKAAAWLRQMLANYGVIIGTRPDAIQVWLPSVGRGWIRARATAPPVIRKFEVYPTTNWTVHVQEQARTRGLPPIHIAAEQPWHGFSRGSQVAKDEVTRMKPTQVRGFKLTTVIPLDQWPKDIGQVKTAFVELPLRSPEDMTITVRVSLKSARKADRAKREYESAGQEPIIMVQGQLMPNLTLVSAGLQVQPRAMKEKASG